MNFAHPKMLWLLAITVSLLAVFLWWSWRKRLHLVSQFVRSRLLAHLTVGLSRGVQKARMVLLVVAVGALILTLARPQWGFAWEEAHQRGLDIAVAIDTSRSMLAEDIAPNRLQRAKLAALDLMRLAQRDRLGLVAFAGTAFLQCPLTLDDEAFRQSVNQLDVGIIPQGGTALAEAIQVAQGAFKEDEDNHKVLILFTDGEDHDSGALEAAEKAAKSGLRIFTVGIGTANGELLRQVDEKGNASYVKDAEGNVVKSRLNEQLLTQIATAAQGFYLAMRGANAMEILYQRGLAPLPKGEINSKLVKQFKERFQWPLALAIVLLVIEVFLPDRRRVKRSEAMVMATNPELRKMVALLALALSSVHVAASSSSALRKYESGQFKDAYNEYSRLLNKRPDDVRLQYNAGSAAYQAKKFEEAAKHFSSAVTSPDLQLQEQAFYNLGNSLYRVGEEETAPEKKSQTWEQAAKQFESALKLNPKDADAQFNLEYVKKKLEELKEQQKQQQKNQDKKDDKDKKDEQKDEQEQKDQQKDQKDSNSDQKDQEKKQQDQPNQQQNDPKDQKDDKGQKDQKDADKKEQEKKEQQKQEKKQGDDDRQDNAPKPGDKQEGENSAEAAPVKPGQMTPEQAKQLLEAQKSNEKAMIFLPPEKAKATKRIFKDW